MASILASKSVIAAAAQAKLSTGSKTIRAVAPLTHITFDKSFATGSRVMSAPAAPRQARMANTIRLDAKTNLPSYSSIIFFSTPSCTYIIALGALD
jgi:hypothetical protein